MSLIDDAYARRDAAPPPRAIDYDRMNRLYPRQKAALTRAVNAWHKATDGLPYWQRTEDPAALAAAERIAVVCTEAIAEWRAIGAWPDGWHTWNIALRDATGLEMDDLR